jgi:hypothetical protein
VQPEAANDATYSGQSENGKMENKLDMIKLTKEGRKELKTVIYELILKI